MIIIDTQVLYTKNLVELNTGIS